MLSQHSQHILRNLQFDDDDLLLDPAQWSEAVATAIAEREGVGPLGFAHWQAIAAIRAYYFRFHAPPPMSKICREDIAPASCVQELFHTCLKAWRIAGLPYPGEEAKSYLSATR